LAWASCRVFDLLNNDELIPWDENISIQPWSEIFSRCDDRFNGGFIIIWVEIGVWSHID
jgi:hypothetical protein